MEEHNLPLETVSVFLRNNRVSSITVASELKSTCPIKGYQTFGTACNGRFIVGVEQRVYEYKPCEAESQKWFKLPSTKMDRSGSNCCVISKNRIVVTGGYGQGMFTSEILNIEPCGPSLSQSPSEGCPPTSISKGTWNSFTKPNVYWKCCATKPPVNVRYHTTTYLGGGYVMLIGGMNLQRGGEVYSKSVFLGEITKDQEDVKWTELNPLIKCRYGHIAFKIGETVIATGGCNKFEKYKSTEIYDLKVGKWKQSNHSLPVGLSNASVMVDSQERFAVITGGETDDYKTSDRIYLYSEKHGFREHLECKLTASRKGHVSLITR